MGLVLNEMRACHDTLPGDEDFGAKRAAGIAEYHDCHA